MRWNTVLFDLDGTVTDPKEGITCAVAYALRQQGIIADPDTLTSFIGPPLHESFPELFGLTEEQTDRAVEDFRAYFSRQGWAENIPYKGMAELLESLQGAGLKLVIATSKPEEFALRIMEHFGLAAYFHRICGAQREDRASAQKGSVVGDRRFDVAGAHENGLPAIGVLYGYGGREELENAGADYLAADLHELKQLLLQE